MHFPVIYVLHTNVYYIISQKIAYGINIIEDISYILRVINLHFWEYTRTTDQNVTILAPQIERTVLMVDTSVFLEIEILSQNDNNIYNHVPLLDLIAEEPRR